MTDTTLIRLDNPTHRKLKMLAAHRGKSMIDVIRRWTDADFYTTFEVVDIGELPHPEDAEPVKIVYVQRRDPA